MIMNWILVKDKLPKFEKQILVWGRLGHVLNYEIAALHDTNGANGYIECTGPGGTPCRLPNKEYPDNLEWNIGGHWRDFEKVTHWAELPNKPIKDK